MMFTTSFQMGSGSRITINPTTQTSRPSRHGICLSVMQWNLSGQVWCPDQPDSASAQKNGRGRSKCNEPCCLQPRGEPSWTPSELTNCESCWIATAKYCRLAGTGKASADIREIAVAAAVGKVESFFVDVHALQWGTYDPRAAAVSLHKRQDKDSYDLLDWAAVQTLTHRGIVYSVENRLVPSNGSVAAIFRY